MTQSNANINVEGESLSVVILPPPVKFRGEWMFLFRRPLAELPDQLSPLTRAVFLDLIAVGNVSVYGLVMTTPSALFLHGVSRSSVYRAIEALQELGIVTKNKTGLIYVNPHIAYRGSGKDWGIAVSYWNNLREVKNG